VRKNGSKDVKKYDVLVVISDIRGDSWRIDAVRATATIIDSNSLSIWCIYYVDIVSMHCKIVVQISPKLAGNVIANSAAVTVRKLL